MKPEELAGVLRRVAQRLSQNPQNIDQVLRKIADELEQYSEAHRREAPGNYDWN